MRDIEMVPQLHESCKSCICSVCLIAQSNGGAPGCGNCDACKGEHPWHDCSEFYTAVRPAPIKCDVPKPSLFDIIKENCDDPNKLADALSNIKSGGGWLLKTRDRDYILKGLLDEVEVKDA